MPDQVTKTTSEQLSQWRREQVGGALADLVRCIVRGSATSGSTVAPQAYVNFVNALNDNTFGSKPMVGEITDEASRQLRLPRREREPGESFFAETPEKALNRTLEAAVKLYIESTAGGGFAAAREQRAYAEFADTLPQLMRFVDDRFRAKMLEALQKPREEDR